MRIINLVNDLNYLEGKRYGEKQEYKEVKKEHKTEENSGDVHGGKNRKARLIAGLSLPSMAGRDNLTLPVVGRIRQMRGDPRWSHLAVATVCGCRIWNLFPCPR